MAYELISPEITCCMTTVSLCSVVITKFSYYLKRIKLINHIATIVSDSLSFLKLFTIGNYRSSSEKIWFNPSEELGNSPSSISESCVSYEFMFDRTQYGLRLTILNIVDEYSRHVTHQQIHCTLFVGVWIGSKHF